MAVLQSLQQKPASQSGFAHAGRPRQHQILVLGDEVEFRRRRAFAYGLPPGWRAQGNDSSDQRFRQFALRIAPLQSTFLPVVPLRTQQPGDKLRVRGLRFFGGA